LAGGRGERFWPLSRAEKPKQFLRLTSDRTMLEETVDRVRPLIDLENIRIVAGESMSRHILSAAKFLDERNILTEPRGRNTCLAIGLAAVHLEKQDPDAVMVVLSSDHLIRPAERLVRIIDDGCKVANTNHPLITIGIVATRPETGYGYIKLGEEFPSDIETPLYRVAAFVEKPKAIVAQEYYYSRKYLWNSGMFIWSAKAILKTIGECHSKTRQILDEYAETIGTDREQQARQELYEQADSISIDYAVLERAKNVLVLKADIVWDDVGSWLALERYKDKDGDNNVSVGDTILMDTFETTVYNNGDGVIACLGVSDLVVVRADEVTFVAHKAKLGEIKQLLKKLGEDEKTDKYL
jgi:mannose-1-phosphate guanylyltransferase